MKKGYKECPFCGEEIKEKAIKCMHCKEYLNKEENKRKEESNENKIVEESKELESGIDNIFIKFIIQLFGSILNIILRILGFALSPFSIPDIHDELDFLVDGAKGWAKYLFLIYLVGGIFLLLFLFVLIPDFWGFNWNDLFIDIGIFYSYHSIGYIISLLLCKYKYKDKYKERLKQQEKIKS